MRKLREEDGIESDSEDESKWEGWDVETDSSETSDEEGWMNVGSDDEGIVVSDSEEEAATKEDEKEEGPGEPSQPPRMSTLATTKVSPNSLFFLCLHLFVLLDPNPG